MPAEDFTAEVQALLSRKLLIEAGSLETDLLDNGSLDSVTLVQLFLHLEENFGIRVDLNELEVDDFRSVRSIARLVAAQKRPSAVLAP